MRGIVAPVVILLLVLVHAPTQAQAWLSDLLPVDWLHLSSSEPMTLVLTGLALLSLARVSFNGVRPSAEPRPRRVRAADSTRVIGADTAPTSTRRAA
ncbi:MAG TPA: hypothetical protein VID04_01110 [Methylomirabilota bacterium]|jgi:hypothetical protein